MQYEFYESIGSQPTKPAEIDTTSSAYYVYERKNIERYEERDDQEQVIFSGWKYLERKIPKDEWVIEATAKTKQNVDALMLGMADLYELQLGVF